MALNMPNETCRESATQEDFVRRRHKILETHHMRKDQSRVDCYKKYRRYENMYTFSCQDDRNSIAHMSLVSAALWHASNIIFSGE